MYRNNSGAIANRISESTAAIPTATPAIFHFRAPRSALSRSCWFAFDSEVGMTVVGSTPLRVPRRRQLLEVGEQDVELGVDLRLHRGVDAVLVLGHVQAPFLDGLPQPLHHDLTVGLRRAHLIAVHSATPP